MDDTTNKRNKKYIQKVLDYKKVFASEQGLRVLDDLMSTHGMLRSSVGNVESANQLFFNEGERNVVLRILKMISMDPEMLRHRIKEIEAQ